MEYQEAKHNVKIIQRLLILFLHSKEISLVNRLQEMDSNNSRPSTIECHLTNDLTDAVVPGDVIDVIGLFYDFHEKEILIFKNWPFFHDFIAVVKVTADPDPRNKGDKKAGGDNIFMVYLDVLSIDNGAQNQILRRFSKV